MSKLTELTTEVRQNKDMRREAYSMSIYVAIILLSARRTSRAWFRVMDVRNVALLSMLAVVVTPTSIELAAARFTAATTIGALVFLESRTSNTALRAAVYSLTGACIGPATGAESTVIRVLGGLCC